MRSANGDTSRRMRTVLELGGQHRGRAQKDWPDPGSASMKGLVVFPIPPTMRFFGLFESRHERLLPRRHFYRRQFKTLLFGLVVLALALGIGMAGYHWLAGLRWVDALLNASMILTGMGPVDRLPDSALAKVFASAYALFSGVLFITVMAIVLSPAVHRLLHKFHLEEADERGDEG